MTRWKSLGVGLAALLVPAVLNAQQEPLRNVVPRNTWKD